MELNGRTCFATHFHIGRALCEYAFGLQLLVVQFLRGFHANHIGPSEGAMADALPLAAALRCFLKGFFGKHLQRERFGDENLLGTAHVCRFLFAKEMSPAWCAAVVLASPLRNNEFHAAEVDTVEGIVGANGWHKGREAHSAEAAAIGKGKRSEARSSLKGEFAQFAATVER